MLAPSDPFWSVADREQHEEQKLLQQIDQLQRAINLRNRAQAIRSATGFQEVVTSLEAIISKAVHNLESDRNLTNEGLREMRGYVRGLKDVLALLTRSDPSDHLDRQLAQCNDLLNETRKRRPKRTEVSEP